MKLNNYVPKKNQGYFSVVLVLLFAVVLLSSCLKNDDQEYYEQPAAAVSFVNGSSANSTLDLGVNNRRVLQNALEYGKAYPYVLIATGKHTIQMVPGGSNSVAYSQEFTFEEGKYYSIFALPKDAESDSVRVLFTQDNVSAPAEGKAKIRFVQLIPGATYDLVARGQENALFTGRTFKAVSDFIEINPGTFTFDAEDGEGEVVASSAANITIEAKKIYTVFTGGKTDGSGAQEPKVFVYEAR